MIYFYTYVCGLREEMDAFHGEEKKSIHHGVLQVRYPVLVKMVF